MIKPIILWITLIVASWSWAETIELKSGQIIKGKIIVQNKDSIQVDVGVKVPLTYFTDEIKQILADIPQIKKKKKKFIPSQADRLEQKAVELIDENKMDEGIQLMEQAVELGPTPLRRMNYGSILFGHGAADFKKGSHAQALKTLYQAQQQLNQAIEGFDPKKIMCS